MEEILEMDNNERLILLIKKAVEHVQILNEIIPTDSIRNLKETLLAVQRLYPINFRQFVLQQLMREGAAGLKEPLYITFDSDTYKLLLEKVEKIPPTSKRKWYQF